MDEFKNNMLYVLIDGLLGYIVKEIIYKLLGSVILYCIISFIFFFKWDLYMIWIKKFYVNFYIFFLYVFNN